MGASFTQRDEVGGHAKAELAKAGSVVRACSCGRRAMQHKDLDQACRSLNRHAGAQVGGACMHMHVHARQLHACKHTLSPAATAGVGCPCPALWGSTVWCTPPWCARADRGGMSRHPSCSTPGGCVSVHGCEYIEQAGTTVLFTLTLAGQRDGGEAVMRQRVARLMQRSPSRSMPAAREGRALKPQGCATGIEPLHATP